MRQLKEIVVVSADTKRGAAVSGVVEAGNDGERLRKHALLHFAGDLHFAVEAFAVSSFGGE